MSIVQKCRRAEKSATVMLVERNPPLALQAADDGYVTDSGTVRIAGDAKKMLNDPKVREAYVGE